MTRVKAFSSVFFIASLYSTNLSYIESRVRELAHREPAQDKKEIISSKKNSEVKRKKKEKSVTKSTYEYMSQFPDSSYPIDGKITGDSIKNKFSPDVNTQAFESGVTVKTFLNKIYLKKTETAVLRVDFPQEDRDQISEISGSMNGQKIIYKPTGNGYLANIQLEALKKDKQIVETIITVNGEEKVFINGFKIIEDYYEFKEIVGEQITSEGNLVFDHLFEIKKAGHFILEGSLYYNGELIAGAENVIYLEKGLKEIPLEFYGKILNMKKFKGKLELRNVSLGYVKKSLATANTELLETRHFTQEYTWDQFHNRPYNNPTVLSKLSF